MNAESRCTKWTTELTSRNLSELPLEEREAFQNHLAHCLQCHSTHQRYQQMVLRLRTLPPARPLPNATLQLIRQIERTRREESDQPGADFLEGSDEDGGQRTARRQSGGKSTSPSRIGKLSAYGTVALLAACFTVLLGNHQSFEALLTLVASSFSQGPSAVLREITASDGNTLLQLLAFILLLSGFAALSLALLGWLTARFLLTAGRSSRGLSCSFKRILQGWNERARSSPKQSLADGSAKEWKEFPVQASSSIIEVNLPPWPGSDDRIVVEEMLRDNLSEHWYECREFVRKQVFKKVSSNALMDKDDIVQDIMRRVYGGLADFHFNSRFTTWLMGIITHCVIDAYRKLKRTGDEASASSLFCDVTQEAATQEPDRLSTLEGVEEICINREELEVGKQALQEYIAAHANAERNEIILDLVIFKGYTLEDAAKASGCSPAVAGYIVRQAQLYARRKRDQWRTQQSREKNAELQ